MTQYWIFLALAPIAFAGNLSALLLPRIVHTYQRFAWLRLFNYVQLFFLLNNTVELLVRDTAIKQALAAVDYLFLGSGPRSGSSSASSTPAWSAISGLGRPCSSSSPSPLAPPAWQTARAASYGAGCVSSGSPGYSSMRTDGYGPAALVLFAYDYAFLAIGAAILFKHTILSHKLYRRQTAWLLAGVLLPSR